MASQKPTFMRISRSLWNKTEKAHADAVERVIELQQEAFNANQKFENELLASRCVKLGLTEDVGRLMCERDTVAKQRQELQREVENLQRNYSAAFNDSETLREQIKQLQEEKDEIALRFKSQRDAATNIEAVNAELRHKLAYFIALAQRIAAP